MMRLTALLLLAASVAGFSSLPKDSGLPDLDLVDNGGGRTSNNPSEVCSCDITLVSGSYGFTCKDRDLSPVRMNWCLQCYSIREDQPTCATALTSAILSSCSFWASTQNTPVGAEWKYIIEQVTDGAPVAETCTGNTDEVGFGSCPALTAGKTQIGPINDSGYSTKYCSSVQPGDGETCEDYFGYYNFASDPDSILFIYPCVSRARRCVGTGLAGKLFCGGAP